MGKPIKQPKRFFTSEEGIIYKMTDSSHGLRCIIYPAFGLHTEEEVALTKERIEKMGNPPERINIYWGDKCLFYEPEKVKIT